MENKFDKKTEEEINNILKRIEIWKDFFFIDIKFFVDGWGIFLKEKRNYPRNIVIFKPHEKSCYTIKSFEILMTKSNNEKIKEIYSVENIKNQDNLYNELKEIIFGKDLLNNVLKIHRNSALNK